MQTGAACGMRRLWAWAASACLVCALLSLSAPRARCERAPSAAGAAAAAADGGAGAPAEKREFSINSLIDSALEKEFRKDELMDMFEQLMLRFSSGELRPSPVREFPLESIAKGFEYLARAEHIGKVVFTIDQNMDDADRIVERFNSRFGAGIGMQDGLDVFDRLLSSDESPSQVMIAAEALNSQARIARHQASGGKRRIVDTEYRDPATTTEELLKQIWEKTLGVTPIGIDDHFSELGGDSINAIMLQASINDAFKLDLTLAVFLSHPTIAVLGKMIDESVQGAS